MTIEYFAERNPGTRILPRSVATSAGSFVFVGHQVARTEDGSIVTGGIEAHTRQTLKNVAHVLALTGCTLDDVVKTTVWLEDPRDFDEFNRVYAEFFLENKPSRSTLQAKNMAVTKIEIEAMHASIETASPRPRRFAWQRGLRRLAGSRTTRFAKPKVTV